MRLFVHAVHLLSFLRRSDPFWEITSPWRAIFGWAKARFDALTYIYFLKINSGKRRYYLFPILNVASTLISYKPIAICATETQNICSYPQGAQKCIMSIIFIPQTVPRKEITFDFVVVAFCL